MSPERFGQIRKIFEAVVECDPQSRAGMIRELCGGDESLAAEVEELVAADGQTHKILDGRTGSCPDDDLAKRFAPGTVLSGRYTIMELLGTGGMGAVYKARDRDLAAPGHDEIVAIKTILPELANRPQFMRRFRDEIALSRRIGHKNVAHIFDLGSIGEAVYFTMEFIEGQNLKELLKERQRFSAEDAAAIIAQLAEGLDAIHEHNVIHRDLKTRNVMVRSNGQAVIMDFGLARSYEPADKEEGTKTIGVMGTPGYMSPEQILDEPLDQRSDVYSLGIIFCELLSGNVPFGSDLRSRLAHLEKSGKSPQLPSSVPSSLNRIIQKCLAKEPANRYQTATQLLKDLNAWRLPPVPRATATGWKIASVLLALVSVALAVWAGLTAFGPPASPPSPISLLIADFDNETGDPDFSGGTLESVLSIALESASIVTSYNRGQARATARQLSGSDKLTEKLAHEVAVREGIQDVVAGSLARRGSSYVLSIRVVAAGTSKVIISRRTDAATKQGVLDNTGKIAAPIRKKLGETKATASPETFTAASVPAMHSYAVAQELQLEGKTRDAIRNYQHAIQIDPDLGRAYAGLAVAYLNLGESEESARYYGEALKHIDRMTDREKYRTRGGYYVMSGNLDKALDEYSELVQRYPADNAGLANLAYVLLLRRDMRRAVEAGGRALAIYPRNVSQRNNFALYEMYSGDFHAALQEARKALALNPSYERAFLATALSQLGEERVADSRETYEQLENVSADGASLAALGLADIALYQGHAEEAIGLLKHGAEGDQASGKRSAQAIKLAALGETLLRLGRTDEASVDAAQAMALDNRNEAALFPAARVLVGVQSPQARAAAEKLAQSPRADAKAYGKLIQGEQALKNHEYDKAIALFLEARKFADTWFGRFDLGRAYVEIEKFTEADSELDECVRRRGEAAALFLDDRPTYRYFPPVYYYQGRAREGLKSPGAAESYAKFLAIKDKAGQDPLVSDAQMRIRRVPVQQ